MWCSPESRARASRCSSPFRRSTSRCSTPSVPKETLASIRYFFSAAATMPEEISRRWTDAYGLRGQRGLRPHRMLAVRRLQPRVQAQVRLVGTAVDDFDVKIFDENDRELPRGQWGEIVIRGPGRDEGILEQAQGHRMGAARRLAALGRHRQDGRGELRLHRRSRQGHDQRLRLQGVAGRSGERAVPAPRGTRNLPSTACPTRSRARR